MKGRPTEFTMLWILQHIFACMIAMLVNQKSTTLDKFVCMNEDGSRVKKNQLRKKSWIFPIQIYETYFKTSDKYLTYHKQNEIILRQEL